MLKIKNLQNDIFGPVSLELARGQSLVVRGPSGSGKTRFLRAVADLDPARGDVLLEGRAAAATPAFDWRRRVRFVPAESAWWLETVAPHFRHAGSLGTAMAALGLSEKLMASRVRDLSTGERQRLAFLRAIEDEPDVLLLDEPTSALDEQSIARMEGLIDKELSRGAIVMLSTHSPVQAEKYGALFLTFNEGAAVIENGRAVEAIGGEA